MLETINNLAMLAAFDAWDAALSLLIFVSVVGLIVAVFGQGGQAQISPQRAAALATGHTDRKTVFENPYMRPLAWMMLVLAHRLNLPRVKATISRQLVAAGSPDYYTAEEYLAIALLTGVVLAAIILGLAFAVTQEWSIGGAVTGFVVGVAACLLQLYSKSSKRLRAIARQVPYSLDLVALAMGAGATFTEAIKTVIREDSDDPFNQELRTVLAEIELGSTRARAMQNLGARVPLDAVRSIVAAIVQAESLGSPLQDVLRDEASVMRLHRSVRAETIAAVASVRILLPGMLILVTVVLAIFAPAIVRIVQNGGLF